MLLWCSGHFDGGYTCAIYTMLFVLYLSVRLLVRACIAIFAVIIAHTTEIIHILERYFVWHDHHYTSFVNLHIFGMDLGFHDTFQI